MNGDSWNERRAPKGIGRVFPHGFRAGWDWNLKPIQANPALSSDISRTTSFQINICAHLRHLRSNLCGFLGLLYFTFLSSVAAAAEDDKLGLRPPRGELHPSFWEQHGWLIALAAIAILAGIGFWLRWRRRTSPAEALPPEVLARRALEALRGRAEDAVLAAEASRILRRYLVAAYGLPPEELTTTELREALQSHPQAGPELVAALSGFLRHCDERKFAPVPPAATITAVARALELVETVEAHRRPMLPANPPPGPAPASPKTA